MGRFINADGYVSTGQGVLGYNMFAYCLNNPVNRFDDTGCMSCSKTQELTMNSTYDGVGIAMGAVLIYALIRTSQQESTVVSLEKVIQQKEKTEVEETYVNIVQYKKTVIFPNDPNEFNPIGLIKVPRDGTKNGAIISWMDPVTNVEVFRWDENLNFANGPHYHIYGAGHYYPETIVPEPYATIYFPFK